MPPRKKHPTARQLAAPVWVADQDGVTGRYWGPGDDVPAEVAERITNPKAWTVPDADGWNQPDQEE